MKVRVLGKYWRLAKYICGNSHKQTRTHATWLLCTVNPLEAAITPGGFGESYRQEPHSFSAREARRKITSHTGKGERSEPAPHKSHTAPDLNKP